MRLYDYYYAILTINVAIIVSEIYQKKTKILHIPSERGDNGHQSTFKYSSYPRVDVTIPHKNILQMLREHVFTWIKLQWKLKNVHGMQMGTLSASQSFYLFLVKWWIKKSYSKQTCLYWMFVKYIQPH